jgi:hypothetical protein
MTVIDLARTERQKTTPGIPVAEGVRQVHGQSVPGFVVEDGALAGLPSVSDVVVLLRSTDRQASRVAMARQTPRPVRETERAKNNRPHSCS